MPPVADPRPPSEQVTTRCLLDDFEFDLFSRWVLTIVGAFLAVPALIAALCVWVAWINNWNLLNWLE